MGKTKDLTGQKFGKLSVIEFVGIQNHKAMFKCKCECGKECVKQGVLLTNGKTKSCGCLAEKNTDQTTHGLSKTHLYGVWCTVKSRCYNSNSQHYKNYGGRGIKMCEEWKSDYMAFHNWSIQSGYNQSENKKHLTLDRIDVNGDYSPKNCRWVNQKEQCNNKTNNLMITYKGKTQTLHQWADETGIKYGTLWARIQVSHWSIEKALTTP